MSRCLDPTISEAGVPEVDACVGPCLQEIGCAFSCGGHAGCVEGCDMGDEAKAMYDCGIEKGCK